MANASAEKMKTLPTTEHPASFRDPDGFIFVRDSILYRQVNRRYLETYQQVKDSGFLGSLFADGLLIPHEEADPSLAQTDEAACILRPEMVPFVSYPYEWSFSQLKDAALLTLEIQKRAMEYDLTLKDASAYNIQFYRGRPVFIDTLSFTPYRVGTPWIPYRQFCQHFLAPLALMAYTHVGLSRLASVYIDGVPLDLASRLLPWKTRLDFGLLTHLHWHAGTQKQFEGKSERTASRQIGRNGLLGFLDNLGGTVRKLDWKPEGTEWGDYYGNTNYSDAAFQHKRVLAGEYITAIEPCTVWDLGANRGEFSRIASEQGIPTVAFDVDPAAVEQNYRHVRKHNEAHLLPLVMDLTNPSPDLGWANRERDGMNARGPVDAAMALALVHHLAIGNNLPLGNIAAWFAGLCSHLIIEFVPKSDSQVQRLLSTREDIFPDYHQEAFEAAFGRHFNIERAEPIRESERTLYWLSKQV